MKWAKVSFLGWHELFPYKGSEKKIGPKSVLHMQRDCYFLIQPMISLICGIVGIPAFVKLPTITDNLIITKKAVILLQMT